MPKVAVVGFDASPLCRNVSGVGRYTYNIIREYAIQNPSVSVILICFAGDTINPSYELSAKNISVHRIPIPRKLYQFAYRKLFRLPCDLFLKRLHLDVIVCTNFTIFPNVKSVPSIVTIHDLAYVRFPETIEQKNLRYLSKHVPKSLNEATRVTTISNFTRDEITEVYGVDKERVQVIGCGVNTADFKQANSKRKPVLLAVGTLEPRKNISKLIEAFSKLPNEVRRQYTLKIVGASGWGEQTGNRVPNGVEILGFVPDDELKQLYGTSTLVVFPSIYEGFGLPILEAFASNTPVACSDIAPFREVAQSSATYFDPTSSKTIADGIIRALDSHQTFDYTPVLQKWSWQRSAAKLTKLIESL